MELERPWDKAIIVNKFISAQPNIHFHQTLPNCVHAKGVALRLEYPPLASCLSLKLIKNHKIWIYLSFCPTI